MWRRRRRCAGKGGRSSVARSCLARLQPTIRVVEVHNDALLEGGLEEHVVELPKVARELRDVGSHDGKLARWARFLATDAFISASSFQQTTKVLTEAAI